MKTIVIKTQKEWDDLPSEFEEYTRIEIRSSETIGITRNPGNSTVIAYDNSTVTAYSGSTVTAYSNSTVIACGNSTVTAYSNSTVRAYSGSTVTACGNSTVTAYSGSTVTACGNSTVTAYSGSTVTAYSGSTVTAYDNSTVTACGNSTVTAYDNSTVYALQSCVVRVLSTPVSVRAFENSIVYNNNTKAKIELYDSSIEYTPEKNDISFDEWINRGFVVADGIYKKYVSHKDLDDMTIYETDDGFVARKKDTFAHGETEEEAKFDLRFKLSSRDKNQFKEWNLDEKKSKEDMIIAYRVITGACRQGVAEFIQSNKVPEKLTVKQVIKLTANSYGGDCFKRFFDR